MPGGVLPRRWAALAALGCGLLVGLSMPPWGWWPLTFVGIGGFATLVDAAGQWRRRMLLGWCFAAGWLYLAMAWMWFLSAPGYIVATALFAGFHAVAAAIVPVGRWQIVGRAAAHTVAEAIRLCWPFGGVPLATLPISQADGPLLPLARVGGVVLFTWFVFQLAMALTSALTHLAGAVGLLPRPDRQKSDRAPMAVAAGACMVVVLAALIAPTGVTGGRTLRVAAVQGGGEQGTRAVSTPAGLVLQRHLAATATIQPGTVDVVVWPENVIDVATFAGSTELDQVTAEARRLNVPMVVSITEDTDDNRFTNAQVVVTPDGRVVSRYDKVRRVPFGEYMPLRAVLKALGAPTDLVPRDAVAGRGPAVLDLGDGTKFGVAISWEIFFGGRVNEGVVHGGEAEINPTNGSSYTLTILQTQQVASSRLRAVEQGRWVIQASPTGFSAFIDPSGNVYQRTAVSERKVIIRRIELNHGRTWYSRLGDLPFVGAAVLVLAVALATDWSARRRHVDDDGDGTVVDDLDEHLGAEPAAGDAAAELA